MSKNSTSKSEILIGALGLIIIVLITAVCVLLVVHPLSPADVAYQRESNLMAIENQQDYGLDGLTGESMSVYVDQYAPQQAPACTRH